MTNQQWLATISPDEWYSVIDWLFHVYGKQYADSYKAITLWLEKDRQEV